MNYEPSPSCQPATNSHDFFRRRISLLPLSRKAHLFDCQVKMAHRNAHVDLLQGEISQKPVTHAAGQIK